MPLPQPRADEESDDWMERCMAHPTMRDEYPDEGQRYRICESLWEQAHDGGDTVKQYSDPSQYYGDCTAGVGIPLKSDLARAVDQLVEQLDADARSYLERHRARDFRTGAELNLCRVRQAPGRFELRPDDRTDISLITTDAVDLDREVIDPDGINWGYWQRNGQIATWVHDYHSFPPGRGLWVKRTHDRRGNGWTAATRAHDRPDWWQDAYGPWLGDVVNHYVQQLGMRGKSIGFVPLELRDPTEEEIQQRPELGSVRLIISKIVALEWAYCPIQCNPEAVVTDMAQAQLAGVETPAVMLKGFGLDAEALAERAPKQIAVGGLTYSRQAGERSRPAAGEKGPTGDTELPLADEDEAWDADSAERRVRQWAGGDDDLDWEQYRRAFFWYDSKNPEVLSSYKLPFADVIDGSLRAVWRGVAGAMAALNGSRGGVDIPEGDREGVYRKIGSYYRRFDREPPDLAPARSAEAPPQKRQPRIYPSDIRRELDARARQVLGRVPGLVTEAIERAKGRV